MDRWPDVVADPDESAWERAVTLHEEAAALCRMRCEVEALPLAEAALSALAEAVGPGHPDTANAHDMLAEVHARLGHPGVALDHLRRAHAILERFRDEVMVEPLRLRVGGRLAYWLAVAGDYLGAEATVHVTLADVERCGDAELRYETLNTLGVILRFQGRYHEAADAYSRARAALDEAALPVPATLLHNLSGLAAAREAFAEAETLAREAIAVRRLREGDGIGLAMDLAGLGDALAALGRHSEAERAYREALDLYARVAPENPEVAYALHNLADLLATMGRPDEAEAAYRESIARKETAFGAAHHEIAGSLANLAALLSDVGREREARDLCSRAVAMTRALLAPDHHVRVACEALWRAIGDAP